MQDTGSEPHLTGTPWLPRSPGPNRGAATPSARRAPQILAGRGGASPGRARIRHLSWNLAARLNLRRGHDRRPSRRPPVPGLVRAEVWGALT